MASKLTQLQRRRKINPTYRPRNDGHRWNVSQIGEAVGMHRDTVRKRLRAAGIEPDGRVSNSPVYELRRAMPALFGQPPRAPSKAN